VSIGKKHHGKQYPGKEIRISGHQGIRMSGLPLKHAGLIPPCSISYEEFPIFSIPLFFKVLFRDEL
jgi:hypothetical protein